MALVGWVEWDPEVTDGEVYVAWDAALDIAEARLELMLRRGYGTALTMVPADQLEAFLVGDLPIPFAWKQAQIILARYHWARDKAGNGEIGNTEYGVPDASRKLWLDARDLIRPRRGLKGLR